MDSTNPIVLDISSDDEPDPHGDDHDWLTNVLGAVDKKSDDLDEVVVVAEVKNSLTTKHHKSKSTKPTVEDEEDDGDCVVLDGDPDKPVSAVDDDGAEESDEVLVVGQKGQIACRDFPHPRHSCAKYPFSSTPHEKYCDMCHCYVCDTHAPCAYWCIGVSTIDHCHANDREEIWKSQRQYFKTGKKSPLPVLKPPSTTTTLSMVPPQLNRAPTQNIIRLAPIPQNQISIQACSSSSGIGGIPNIRARCRIRQSRIVLNNHGFQARSHRLLGGVRNTVIRKDRGLGNNNLSPQLVSSNTTLENPRPGGGGSVANLSGYDSLNNDNSCARGLQYTQSPSSLASQNNGWQEVSSGINLEMYKEQSLPQPNLACFFPTTLTSQTHVYSQHIGQNTNEFNCKNQSNMNQFTTTKTAQPMVDCQNQSSQQVGVKDFPQTKLLSDFEDWLLENRNVPDSSLSEPVGLDEGLFTFDFETFLNN